jgi:hypothetical protein
MPQVAHQYTSEIHDELGYWATWLPSKQLHLGDCGRIRDREFTVEATLADFGIDFESVSDTNVASIQHATHGGVDWHVEAKGDNKSIPQIPQGSAGFIVDLSKGKALVLVVSGAVEERIADVPSIQKKLDELAASGDFDRELAVITHLVKADRATVLIASDSSGQIALSAEVDLTAGLLDLANANAGLSRVASSGLETEIVAEQGLTPLFKLMGFRRRGLFLGRRKESGRLYHEGEAGPVSLSEIAPGDTD